MTRTQISLLVVFAIFVVSFVYTTIKDNRLSDEVLTAKLKECAEEADYDCQLISQYHDDCFDSSYRAEFRIKQFRRAEYDSCIDSAVKKYLTQ